MSRKAMEKDEKKEPSMVKIPQWLELPEDIWANILHRLTAIEIMETAEKVCTTWSRVCKHPSMWRVINMCKEGDICANFKKMCRRAIDRSQGELVDINMHCFATDELLSYIADRSGKLKRLSIACCYGKVCKRLVEVVQKFPLLEELSLTHTTITEEGIEALGRSCPLLKSFALNNSCYMGSFYEFDKEAKRNYDALNIARNLPGLHHLQLIANGLTNKGLQAILDGCPNLVSLDLRLCTNISLDEVLSSRISQIKDVKHPDDSLEGLAYEFEPWVIEDDDRDTPDDADRFMYNEIIDMMYYDDM